FFQNNPVLFRKLVYNHKPGIMPGFFILASRIAETSNNPQLFFLFLFGFLALLNNFRFDRLGNCNRFRSDHFLFNAYDRDQHLMGLGNNTDALSRYYVPYMNRVTDNKWTDIDYEVAWYLVGEAFYFNFSEAVLKHSLVSLYTQGFTLDNYMDHNFNQFSRRNFLEVHVQKLPAYRIHLILFKYCLFSIILELEIYNDLLSGSFA